MIRDTKTIDYLTSLQFKNCEAKERWSYILKHDYFDNSDNEIIIDFARRWAKNIQYLMKQENKSFDQVVVSAAHEADIDGKVTLNHLDKSIDLLVEIWKYGDVLNEWLTHNDGKTAIENLF